MTARKNEPCSTTAGRELLPPDRLPIFFRAHTVKVRKRPKASSKTDNAMPRWPERALLADTESRTSVDQTITIGICRACTLIDGQYRCDEENWFTTSSFQQKNSTPSGPS
jgi:hypothetical protein